MTDKNPTSLRLLRSTTYPGFANRALPSFNLRFVSTLPLLEPCNPRRRRFEARTRILICDRLENSQAQSARESRFEAPFREKVSSLRDEPSPDPRAESCRRS